MQNTWFLFCSSSSEYLKYIILYIIFLGGCIDVIWLLLALKIDWPILWDKIRDKEKVELRNSLLAEFLGTKKYGSHGKDDNNSVGNELFWCKKKIVIYLKTSYVTFHTITSDHAVQSWAWKLIWTTKAIILFICVINWCSWKASLTVELHLPGEKRP